MAESHGDSAVTDEFARLVGKPPAPKWVAVWKRYTSIIGIGRTSANMAYFEAPSALRWLEETIAKRHLTDDAARQAIVTVFGLLEKDGDSYRARQFVWMILEKFPTAATGPPLDTGDLPGVPEK